MDKDEPAPFEGVLVTEGLLMDFVEAYEKETGEEIYNGSSE